jgi:peptidoglycan hydrolase-like protein with peptidoglycan-binding domain
MKQIISSVITLSLLASLAPTAFAQETDVPFERDFVITAYYSPLPGQCCYVKGGEVADKILNGNGTHGADGTAVHPGMIAAPKSYAFGTRISLPGIGIGTVNDRGGAIVEQGVTDRLDIWAGYGEEGLARALAFGVKRVRGTVYPPSTDRPAENLVLENLPAPYERLKPFVAVDGLMDLHVKAGDAGLSVSMLQDVLKQLGYFKTVPTGFFGPETQTAFAAFVAEYQLDEPKDELTVKTAAYLLAAVQQQQSEPKLAMVNPESSAKDIKAAQRLLRYLGFYKGRTNGVYDDKLFTSILAFQQSRQLVGQSDAPGAGRIGPLTKGKLNAEWRRKQVAIKAEQYLLLRRVNEMLAKKGLLISQFLKKGSSGPEVRKLQELLAGRGYFPADKINGNFGDLTAQSVTKYQLAEKLIKSAGDSGAGTIGPFTMRKLRQDTVQESYKLVRGFGLNAL